MAGKKATKKKGPKPSGDDITVVQSGDVTEVKFKSGVTARQALDKAGLSSEDLEAEALQVRLNNKIITDLDVPMRRGDQLMVVGDIGGA